MSGKANKILLLTVVGLLAIAILGVTLLFAGSTQPSTVEGQQESEQSSTNENGLPVDSRDSTSVQNVHGGQSPTMVNFRVYGLRDIFDWIGLVIILILVVILWVVSFIRNRKDPVKQWEKRL